jgi:putative transposase
MERRDSPSDLSDAECARLAPHLPAPLPRGRPWRWPLREITAALQDRAAVPLLLEGTPERFPRLGHVWVDQGHTGSGRDWIGRELGRTVEVVRHPPKPRGEWVPLGTGSDPRPFEWRRLAPGRTGFRGVLPRRWVVERTFSWTGQSRRLAKDYERLPETSETLSYATMSRLMVRRLARS